MPRKSDRQVAPDRQAKPPVDFNYLIDPIYRCRLTDGELRWVSFLDLFGTVDGKEILRPETGLRELDAATYEHFIGLAQVVLAPADEDELLDWIEEPPSRSWLAARVEPFAHVFSLYAAKAFQAPSGCEKKIDPVEVLFLEGAGEKTRAENAVLCHRQIKQVDLRLAMLALAHMQRHSVGSGPDVRAGITGGGALRCLVERSSFFETILANLLPKARFEAKGRRARDLDDLFPWRQETLLSGQITPEDVPASHLYFAVVRAYQLGAPISGEGKSCDLTGESCEWLVDRVHKGRSEVGYATHLFSHPLAPYRAVKKGKKLVREPLAARKLSGRLFWSDRRGLFDNTATAERGGRIAAEVATLWRESRAIDLDERFVRIFLFGHESDKASVRAWQESRLDESAVPKTISDTVENELRKITNAADKMARALVHALLLLQDDAPSLTKEISRGLETVGKDGEGTPIRLLRLGRDSQWLSRGQLSARLQEFWRLSERHFDALARHLIARLEEGDEVRSEAINKAKKDFLRHLSLIAEKIHWERVSQHPNFDSQALVASTRCLYRMTRSSFLAGRIGLCGTSADNALDGRQRPSAPQPKPRQPEPRQPAHTASLAENLAGAF